AVDGACAGKGRDFLEPGPREISSVAGRVLEVPEKSGTGEAAGPALSEPIASGSSRFDTLLRRRPQLRRGAGAGEPAVSAAACAKPRAAGVVQERFGSQ